MEKETRELVGYECECGEMWKLEYNPDSACDECSSTGKPIFADDDSPKPAEEKEILHLYIDREEFAHASKKLDLGDWGRVSIALYPRKDWLPNLVRFESSSLVVGGGLAVQADEGEIIARLRALDVSLRLDASGESRPLAPPTVCALAADILEERKAPQVASTAGDGVIDEAYLARRRDYLFSEMWNFVEKCLDWNASRVHATQHELMNALDHYRETQTKLHSLSVEDLSGNPNPEAGDKP